MQPSGFIAHNATLPQADLRRMGLKDTVSDQEAQDITQTGQVHANDDSKAEKDVVIPA